MCRLHVLVVCMCVLILMLFSPIFLVTCSSMCQLGDEGERERSFVRRAPAKKAWKSKQRVKHRKGKRADRHDQECGHNVTLHNNVTVCVRACVTWGMSLTHLHMFISYFLHHFFSWCTMPYLFSRCFLHVSPSFFLDLHFALLLSPPLASRLLWTGTLALGREHLHALALGTRTGC